MNRQQFVKRSGVFCTVRMKDADTTVETKDGDLEVTGVISGSERDRADEWVNQETLAKHWDGYRRNSIMMYMHSWISPIGKIIDYAREGSDSVARVKFAKGYEVPMPVGFSGVKLHMNDIRSMVEQRVVNSFSIAFDADKVEEHEDKAQLGRLDVTDWYETSLVTIPAYRAAQMRNGFAPDVEDIVKMFIKHLGEERIRQWYVTGGDYNGTGITTSTGTLPTRGVFNVSISTPEVEETDEDPVVLEALRTLDRALSSTPEADSFSEAELAQLRQLELSL